VVAKGIPVQGPQGGDILVKSAV